MHKWETISEDNVAYILNSAEFKATQPFRFYILRNGETLYGNMRLDDGEKPAVAEVMARPEVACPGSVDCNRSMRSNWSKLSNPPHSSSHGSRIHCLVACTLPRTRTASGAVTTRPC